MTPTGIPPAPTPESQRRDELNIQHQSVTSRRNGTSSSRREPRLCYHVRVDLLFAVDVSGGAGKLQQLVGLVHHQGRVELAHFQQVAAENPTQAAKVTRMRRRS